MRGEKHTKEKKEKTRLGFRRMVSDNWYLLKIAFSVAPGYSLYRILDGPFSKIMVLIEHVFMVGYIVNAITQGRPFSEVVWVVLLFLLVNEALIFVGHALFFNRFAPVSEEKIYRHIRREMHRKAVSMDLVNYDDPEFYNNFIWCMKEAPQRIYGLISSISRFLGAVVAIAVAGGYIFSQDKMGLLVVGVSFFGILALSGLKNEKKLKLDLELREPQRRQSYMGRVVYLAEYAKELRLNRIGGRLLAGFNGATEEIREVLRRRTPSIAVLTFIVSFIFEKLIVDGLYLLYLLYRAVVRGEILVGTMVALYNSCAQIQAAMFELAHSLPEFQEHALYVDRIRTFFAYTNKVKAPENPLPLPERIETISFRDVSFRYGEKTALSHVDLTIRAGEKIAIVGYNGAGKSTLAKLLLRLYDVDEGQICLNGTDIRAFRPEEYRRCCMALFQDFQLFAATVGENVAAGPEPLDRQRAEDAMKKSGFYEKLSELEQGYDTPVTREFDDAGVFFSGGEAQRLALARAFYQNSPVIVLDEPSSALDPLAEFQLNQTMYEIGRDKTVITISHRLSTTIHADCIYVFENGRIVEQGTHARLMERQGTYAKMFRVQADQYRLPMYR